MVLCAGLETLAISTVADILGYPSSCDYYFYAKFLAAIFIILTFTLFNKEKESYIRSDMISCMGVSSLAVISLGLILNSMETSWGSNVLPGDVFIEVLVAALIPAVIWIFKD